MNTEELRAAAVRELQELQEQWAAIDKRLQAVKQLIAALDDYQSTSDTEENRTTQPDWQLPAPSELTVDPFTAQGVRRTNQAKHPTLAPQTQALRRVVLEVLQYRPSATWTVDEIMLNLDNRIDLSGRAAPYATVRKVLRQLVSEDKVRRVAVDGRTNGYRVAPEPTNASAPVAPGAEDNEE